MKVLAGYLVLAYVIPAAISPLIRDQLTTTYHDVFGSPWPLLLVVVLPVLVWVLYLFLPPIRIPREVALLNPFRYRAVNVALMLAFLVSAFLFRQNYGLSFRHTGPGMLGAAFYVPLVFGLKVYFKVFALYVFLRAIREGRIAPPDRLILLIAVVATAMSVMAATDIPLLLLMLGLCVVPTRWLLVIFCMGGSGVDAVDRMVRITSYALLVVAGAGAVFVGIANKIGSEETLRLARERGNLVEEIGETVGVRASMHYAVLMTFADRHLFDTERKLDALAAPVSDLRSRICRLAGERCEPTSQVWEPDVWSVSRMTFILVRRTPLERAGITPGLLGTGLIVPFFPLGLLLIGLLATVVVRLVDGAMRRNARSLSLLGVLVFVYYMMPIFNNSLDLMLRPIDPAFVYAGLLFVVLLDSASLRREDQSPNQQSVPSEPGLA
jgi:hypothetical protein